MLTYALDADSAWRIIQRSKGWGKKVGKHWSKARKRSFIPFTVSLQSNSSDCRLKPTGSKCENCPNPRLRVRSWAPLLPAVTHRPEGRVKRWRTALRRTDDDCTFKDWCEAAKLHVSDYSSVSVRARPGPCARPGPHAGPSIIFCMKRISVFVHFHIGRSLVRAGLMQVFVTSSCL